MWEFDTHLVPLHFKHAKGLSFSMAELTISFTLSAVGAHSASPYSIRLIRSLVGLSIHGTLLAGFVLGNRDIHCLTECCMRSVSFCAYIQMLPMTFHFVPGGTVADFEWEWT